MFDYDTYTELKRGTVSRDEMTIAPKNNFTNILVLRELESHAVFTTDGQSADLANVAVGSGDDRETYSPGLMFMRKQTGSDRRFGKSLQRDLLGTECTMQVNGMCQDCVECILYGSAASDDADQQLSITSRVMYDTAYTLRDATAAIDEKFQNAPATTTRRPPKRRSASPISSSLGRCSRRSLRFGMRRPRSSRSSLGSRRRTNATVPRRHVSVASRTTCSVSTPGAKKVRRTSG